ncbi:MAG: hypothetical protein ACXVH2_09955 [Methanobacterium sp.]
MKMFDGPKSKIWRFARINGLCDHVEVKSDDIHERVYVHELEATV